MEVDDIAASVASDTNTTSSSRRVENHESVIEENGGVDDLPSLSSSKNQRRGSIHIRKKKKIEDDKQHSGSQKIENNNKRRRSSLSNTFASQFTDFLSTHDDDDDCNDDGIGKNNKIEENVHIKEIKQDINSPRHKKSHRPSPKSESLTLHKSCVKLHRITNSSGSSSGGGGGKTSPKSVDQQRNLLAKTVAEIEKHQKTFFDKKNRLYDMKKYPSDECLLGYDENGEPEFGDVEEMLDLVSGGKDGSNLETVSLEENATETSESLPEPVKIGVVGENKKNKENSDAASKILLEKQLIERTETPPIFEETKIIENSKTTTTTTTQKCSSPTIIKTEKVSTQLNKNETIIIATKTDEQQEKLIEKKSENVIENNPIAEQVTPTIEEHNISSPITTTTSTTTTPTPDAAVIVPSKPKSQDEYYKKPFDYGWKRELVYRANMETSKDKADVYFITPTGKKLRTKNDIAPLLEGDLTLDHFCFAKEPLGAGPEYEIVRSAKATTRNSMTTSTMNSSYSDRNPVSGKRISKPKLPKGASPPPQGWTPTRVLKNSSSLLNSSSNRNVGSNNQTTPMTPPNSRIIPKTPKTKRNGGIGGGAALAAVGGTTSHEPCTIMCAAAMGLIPQLQCVKCLCLYHHECVGLDRNDIEYRVNSDAGGRSGLHAAKGSKDYICESCIPGGTKEQFKNQKLQKSTTTTTNAPSSGIASAENKGVEKIDSFPQTIAVVKGKKYVMVARPPQPALPPPTPPPPFPPLLPTSQFAEHTSGHHHQIENELRGSPIQNSFEISSKRSNNTSDDYIQNNRNSLAHDHQGMISSSSSSGGGELSFATNFFANVSFGYDAILCILKYLKIDERPRAARVCRIWNLVAKDTSLWQTVRMKNSKVYNWSGFAAALRRGETKHLDLRKMLVPSTKTDETWNEFSKYIGTVCSLEIIDMCRCPAKAVENLFENCRNLRILNAVSINDDTMNLKNIEKMIELSELRLRANELLTLDGDLTPFRSLKNIAHLSLTLIRNLGAKSIEILGELNTLKSLELGECGDFDNKFTDGVLKKLTNLQRLRMENGQETCDTLEILDAISQMDNLQQIEFVNFDIKPGFDDKLMNCINIRKLLVIPTYISQSATTNNVVLQAVLNLKNTLEVFTWGVTLELLRVTALYVDQCEVSKKDDRSTYIDCIPVLKPVPGATAKGSPEPPLEPNAVPQIEILPLGKVRTILADNLKTTKFTIVEVPYFATWKQHLVE